MTTYDGKQISVKLTQEQAKKVGRIAKRVAKGTKPTDAVAVRYLIDKEQA